MAETALVCTSHSPLMNFSDPAPGVRARVDVAFEQARRFIDRFEPDLVVLFAPDHYNGVFYDMMPPYCIGTEAISIGDWDTPEGRLSVDEKVAHRLATAALDADIDVALSMRMYVDHGFAQPLQILFGGLDQIPVVPVFINSVAEPLGRATRSRLLGNAIGKSLIESDRRILYLASGGLSHDPPAPRISEATPDVAERLIVGGRRVTPEEKAERERRVLHAGRQFALGASDLQPLNPEWDEMVLKTLASGDLAAIDSWSTDWFISAGGHSAHEVRTWIAAYSALAAHGLYEQSFTFYEPVPEWIAGFGITCAAPARTRFTTD